VTTYAIVQKATGTVTSVGAGLTATVTLPSPTTAGNKIIVVTTLRSSGSPVMSGFATDVRPAWTLGAAFQATIHSKNTAGGESSWTMSSFTASADGVLWFAYEISGLSSASVDKVASDPGNGAVVTTQTTGTTVTTTSANELAVGLAVGLINGGTTTITGWTNGYVAQDYGTITVSGTTHSIATAFKELTATGTTNSVATFAGAYGFGGLATYAESVVAAVTGRFLAFFS
jgi:hypothetical protein